MSYLLDTCILSIGEIQKGIELPGPRPDRQKEKRLLEDWLHGDLIPRFAGRIVPIDTKVAMTWGEITAECQRKGTPLPAIDGLLAACAIHHGLVLVTENIRNFEPSGVALFNPCKALSTPAPTP